MAIPPNINDREQQKFVESPTRPGETAVEVVGNITNDIEVSTTPVIYNKSVASADTEESQALTTGTKKFMIKVRGNARLQVSFVENESGTKFSTVPPGAVYKEEGLNLTDFTLYFQTSKATQIVEITEWS